MKNIEIFYSIVGVLVILNIIVIKAALHYGKINRKSVTTKNPKPIVKGSVTPNH